MRACVVLVTMVLQIVPELFTVSNPDLGVDWSDLGEFVCYRVNGGRVRRGEGKGGEKLEIGRAHV